MKSSVTAFGPPPDIPHSATRGHRDAPYPSLMIVNSLLEVCLSGTPSVLDLRGRVKHAVSPDLSRFLAPPRFPGRNRTTCNNSRMAAFLKTEEGLPMVQTHSQHDLSPFPPGRRPSRFRKADPSTKSRPSG